MKKEEIQLEIDGKLIYVFRAVRHWSGASQYILYKKNKIFVEYDQNEKIWKNETCGGTYAKN